MAKTGTADEGLRSIGDAAFSHRPCRGRAIPRSPLHSPCQHSYKGGRHSLVERESGRLSQSSFVDEKAAVRSARAPQRMGDPPAGTQRRRERIRRATDELTTLRDVHDDETAHEFVIYGQRR